jgi:hypothetical protein
MTTGTTVTISVEQRDIDAGVIADCAKCPIARAASRAFGFGVVARVQDGVNVGFIAVLDANYSVVRIRDLPPVATQWMRDFDAGRPVQPIVFDVEV